MKYIKLFILVVIVNTNLSTYAQQAKDDTKQLEDLVNSISEGVNMRNHSMILNAFIHPSALIYSTYEGVSVGGHSIKSNTAQGLADFIKDSNDIIKQQFDSVKIEKIFNGRAVVTTYYYVTINGKKSHKGEEFYSAVKTKKGWKFISLMFTLEAWKDQ
ncbi:hypothetical protein [uncultured Psychroserpens sp.]|uniref:hypothetical protein n=1 Tax=uncultured Psychroserpens sp. TaxID=255436 RepID=UPI002607C4DF|nr:hypothetical protein [uncultured Psychroserpens sp.]